MNTEGRVIGVGGEWPIKDAISYGCFSLINRYSVVGINHLDYIRSILKDASMLPAHTYTHFFCLPGFIDQRDETSGKQ